MLNVSPESIKGLAKAILEHFILRETMRSWCRRSYSAVSFIWPAIEWCKWGLPEADGLACSSTKTKRTSTSAQLDVKTLPSNSHQGASEQQSSLLPARLEVPNRLQMTLRVNPYGRPNLG